MRILASLMTVLALGFSAAHAMDMSKFDAGLGVGEKVPASFSVIDQEGNNRDFSSLTAENGAVVFFIRSLKWCPYCKKQTINADEYADQIRALGYNPVTISYDELKHLNRFDKKKDISIEMYSDPGSKVIDAFHLRNEEYKEGHYAHGVPHPAIYIISKDGLIQGKLMEKGYKVRPKPEDVIALIKSIQAGS
ncbi:MAG: peroxiredoxin family protein [Sphingomonadales bacterium]|jgi:peroxiredoxin